MAFCAAVLAQLLAPALLPLLAAVLIVGLAWLLVRLRPGQTSLCLLAASIGLLLVVVHGQAALKARLPAALDGSFGIVQGRIVGLPQQDEQGVRWIFEIERVLDGAPGLAGVVEGRRVGLRWYRGGQGLRSGERWVFAVRWQRPRGAANPAGDDPARRALIENRVADAVVEPDQRPWRLAPGHGPGAWREDRSQAMVEALGEHRARYVRALTIGDTRGLQPADWDWLREWGITHLIAISGFHVGMVAVLGVLAVRLLWWLWPGLGRRCPRAIAAPWGALLVGLVYAGMAGFSLPTVRTVLMIGVLALCHATRLRQSPTQGLALAMLLLALADPFALLTAGFWLSCVGVLALIACLPGRMVFWSPWALLRAQWVASWALLPIVAAWFLVVPLLGPLANLLAIPWISLVVVPLGLLGMAAEPLWLAAATFCWALAAAAMGLLENLLTAWPWPTWNLHLSRPSAPALLLAVIGVLYLLLPSGVPGRWLGLLLLLPLLWPIQQRPAAGQAELWVFDLPRGDAVLLRSASRDLLIDAGPRHSGLPRSLAALGARRPEALWLSSPRHGRSAGQFALGMQGQRIPAAPWVLAFDGLELEALHPAAGFPPGGEDASTVLGLRGDFGEVWLVGDTGGWVAGRLLASRPGQAPPRLLLAAPTKAHEWHAKLAAPQLVVTRAPSATRAFGWPEDWPDPGRSGALRIRLSGTPAAPLHIQGWRRLAGRWWDGEPAQAAML